MCNWTLTEANFNQVVFRQQLSFNALFVRIVAVSSLRSTANTRITSCQTTLVSSRILAAAPYVLEYKSDDALQLAN